MKFRSRTGCTACKSRKRRCGEERPACRNCVVRGVECPYLSEPFQLVSLRFKICRGENVRWTSRRNKRPWHFLTVSSQDIGLLSAEHERPKTPSKDQPEVDNASEGFLSTLRPAVSTGLLDDCNGVERQLFQYCESEERLKEERKETDKFEDLQVICKVRVFQDEPSNHFRSLVAPLCSGKRPLLYAVLSLSANDRRAETNVDYGQLSLSYKSKALRLLRESVADMWYANEALMTCLILCSLEIASGSRPDWVRHAQGAFAIIHSFAAFIDPQILFFVYSYFQFRAVFFLTTSPCGQPADENTLDSQSALQCFPDIGSDVDHGVNNRDKIQPHMGCSLSLLDIIAKTTRLVQQKRELRRTGRSSLACEETLRSQAMSIRSELDSLTEENPSGSDYLATCAECFRMAADLFLQLACDIPLSQPALQEQLDSLLDRIGQVINEDQERQLFPMWPLFLAGCLSSVDEDRLRVLDYFAVLSHQWPISNIPVVREATETIWKSRDLNPDDQGKNGFDWQMIIDQMNWKLALS